MKMFLINLEGRQPRQAGLQYMGAKVGGTGVRSRQWQVIYPCKLLEECADVVYTFSMLKGLTLHLMNHSIHRSEVILTRVSTDSTI